ncbi:hypothetical protein [Streptomyces sp. NPDC005828]
MVSTAFEAVWERGIPHEHYHTSDLQHPARPRDRRRTPPE